MFHKLHCRNCNQPLMDVEQAHCRQQRYMLCWRTAADFISDRSHLTLTAGFQPITTTPLGSSRQHLLAAHA